MAIATSTSVFCVLHRCCHVLVFFLFVFWLRGLFILSRLQARTLFASMPTVDSEAFESRGPTAFGHSTGGRSAWSGAALPALGPTALATAFRVGSYLCS